MIAAEVLESRGRTIFADKDIVCDLWHQFAELVGDTAVMEPAIALHAKQFDQIQIALLATAKPEVVETLTQA